MPTPNPKKQMVVSSLNSLQKMRTKTMFRLKAVRQEKNRLNAEELKVLNNLMGIEKKIYWEINTNSKILNS